jgi:hypothetical protein
MEAILLSLSFVFFRFFAASSRTGCINRLAGSLAALG